MANEVSDSELASLLSTKKIVLLDFYASWCGPCRMLSPILDKLSEDNKSNDSIAIVKLDTDKYKEITASYGISSIPCLILFKDGIETKRIIGYRNQKQLQEEINAAQN